MKRLLILSFIFVLAIICMSSLVYASDIDMNLSTNPASDNTVYGSETNTNTNTNTENTLGATSGQAPTTISPDTSVSVGSTAALSSSNLSLSNILNIILIVLGILLVLFAIAILIRMR